MRPGVPITMSHDVSKKRETSCAGAEAIPDTRRSASSKWVPSGASLINCERTLNICVANSLQYVRKKKSFGS